MAWRSRLPVTSSLRDVRSRTAIPNGFCIAAGARLRLSHDRRLMLD